MDSVTGVKIVGDRVIFYVDKYPGTPGVELSFKEIGFIRPEGSIRLLRKGQILEEALRGL